MFKPLAIALTCSAIPLALACAAPPAAAQNMKPGLWEITSKMGGEQGAKMAAAQSEMQKQLAAMPPEQRKMMEKMMAQQGVSMAPGAAPGGGMATRICISKEMAARNEAPAQPGDCKQETLSRSGNTTKFKFSCSNPPSSGEGEVSFSGSEAYSSKIKTTTQHKGKTETMNMESQGKWLSGDCGNLKPVK
ncbi:MAG: DUF3617 domain-containing protein [Burkholderiales bacterium]|nr:DUF3617 domain-containing protein [Burkholderiales bacterium]